jgi:hypothetical protein
MEAISNAFNTFCTTSFTQSILEDSLSEPTNEYSRRNQSSLIQFRNGGKDAGLLERCGRSFLVEPILVVVALCALVETAVRVVLAIFTSIGLIFEFLDENTFDNVCNSLNYSFSAFCISTSWITKNVLKEKLHYSKDLKTAREPFEYMVAVLVMPIFIGDSLLKSTGLDKVVSTLTWGVYKA